MSATSEGKSKAELKRERRELQEAQRAAKLASRPSAPEKKSNEVKRAKSGPPDKSDIKDTSQHVNNEKEPTIQKAGKNDGKIPLQKTVKPPVKIVSKGPELGDLAVAPSGKSSGAGGSKQSKGTGHALGVMRMDDPSHLKHSIRYLQKNKLQPRLQEPVRVNLFNHLSQPDKRVDVLGDLNLGQQASIHPAFLALGIDIDEGRVSGSNQRCFEFLRATVALINSYPWSEHLADVPATGSFSRSFVPVLVRHVTFLDQCRPLPVTIRNAVQFLKQVLNQMDSVNSSEEVRTGLLDAIDLYVTDRIKLADEAISALVIDAIRPGECICTYGYSSLVASALVRAWSGVTIAREDEDTKKRQEFPKPGCLFSVLVVDSRPRSNGRKMFSQLRKAGIPCELTHIAALPMFAPKITLTLLGAHSLLSNGYVIASVGTAQVANIVSSVAHTPVLVCAETYKFWERAQSDAFEFNELGDPDDIWRGPRGIHEDWRLGLPDYRLSSNTDDPDGNEDVDSLSNAFNNLEFFTKDPAASTNPPDLHKLENWRQRSNLLLLNLAYDVLPPDLVTAVMTELGILPTTSVPVVLRVKQSSVDAEVVL